ncbi:MAG: DUF4159 domain-containing protein [Anaerolineales bacterium]|nr:DUF4159 domain-containing protein [Anaerolineales bacterium]
MTPEELVRRYPLKRIKPFNGMAITATIWDEAHEYHRRSQTLHTLFEHGTGVITGLKVMANDPSDTSLYILPGIAIDQAGQVIVLPEPVVYDIGQEMEGLFYLVLSYGESRHHNNDSSQPKSGPVYAHSDFSITAQTTLTDAPGVELARIKRSSRKSVLQNAFNPVTPGPDEIDLRFRCEVGAPPDIRVAVTYLGDVTQPRHGLGATYLAQTFNHLSKYRVLVEDDVPLTPGLGVNTLVYLVGQGPFELSAGVMNGLRQYVQRSRGTLFIESVDEEAHTSFMNFLTSREMTVQPLTAGHPLLAQPYFFNVPPSGFEAGGEPGVSVGDGVIVSRQNYGLTWQGTCHHGPASREEIRTATEWGANILLYALNRRQG